MVQFFNVNGIKVAEGWNLSGDDLKKLSPDLFLINKLKFATATDLSNPLLLESESKIIGKFLIRDLPDIESTIEGYFIAKNVTIERMS